jgi:hypothetical protein
MIIVGFLSELNNEMISGGNFSIYSKFLGTFYTYISGGRDALCCRRFFGKEWEIGYIYISQICVFGEAWY